MTLTPPVRIVGLVGALVATGLAAVVFVLGRGQTESEPSANSTPVTRTAPSTTAAPTAAPRTPRTQPGAVRTRSGFPAPIDRALRRRGVVVVAVYIPGAAVDSVVRAEARAAASKTRAGYVPISALNERLVRLLVARTGVLPAPAVVIVKRPGVVAATLSVTDRGTIVQAVAQARR